ncbi:MAG: MBG domain-containing protein [Chloroflexota bacterium]|nr:MBG domain-containing protein [Chloroflexota bacterium]
MHRANKWWAALALAAILVLLALPGGGAPAPSGAEGTGTFRVLTVVEDTSTVTFTIVALQYTISLSVRPSEGGTVSGDGTYEEGTSVTVVATANTGYSFVNWTEGETAVSTDASYTFTAEADRTLVANFVLKQYTVSVSAAPAAGGTVTGGGTFNHGASVTVVATANTGYSFVNWTEGETAVSTDASYTFTAEADRTLVANFDTLTITPAALTITADAKAKVYGAADPALTVTYTGFVLGDDASVVSGLTLSTATGAAATAGEHTITASGGTAANYNISHVNGTLTVSKAPLTVTADAKGKVYGAADPDLTYTPSGDLFYGDAYGVIGGVTLSTATGADATAGEHTITASGGTAANYAINHVNGTLTVSKAELTVISAVAQNKVYDGTTAATITGAVLSGVVYTDDVVLGNHATGTFAQAGVGTGIVDTTAMTIGGAKAGNYTLTQPTLTADIIGPTPSHMPGGTVLLGRKAFALDYANNPANLAEIVAAFQACIAEDYEVYVKNFSDQWVANVAPLVPVAQRAINAFPEALYKAIDETEILYPPGDNALQLDE